MLTCREVSELVSQALDRSLGPIERLRLHLHLRVCEACRNFQSQINFLRKCAHRHPTIKERKD